MTASAETNATTNKKPTTHQVEVVPIQLLPHPNPDVHSLSIVKVFGYDVVVNTKQWQDKTKAAYIKPDSVCPDTEQFSFLGEDKKKKELEQESFMV